MKVEAMPSIPAGENPFHYDLFRMGTRINDRFMVMWEYTAKNELVIVDIATGERHRVICPIVVKPKPNILKPVVKQWRNIK